MHIILCMAEHGVHKIHFHYSDLPIDRSIIFTDHNGEYKKRLEKEKTKLLQKISFLKKFLNDDEKIIFVAKGCSPISALESFLIGMSIVYIKRCLLVFTNQGIFHIPTRMNYSYRNSVAQIRYGDCNTIKVSQGSVVIEYKNGEIERFYVGSRGDRKNLKALLEKIPLSGEMSGARCRVHLCPRCKQELVKDRYVCPNCHLAFKNRTEVLKYSIIYPGGGYFYTGHIFLGITNGLAELIIITLIIISLFGTFGNTVNGISFAPYLLVALFIEKAMMVYLSNRFIDEYLPKGETVF